MAEPAASTAYMGHKALTYDENRFTTPAGIRVHQIEHRNLQYALRQIDPAGRVLEVGCGTGRLLMEARAQGYQVEGLDASPDMIELVKRKNDDKYAHLQLYVAEAAQLPMDDDTYDLTYSVRMLNQTESADYAKRAIAEMVRVTKFASPSPAVSCSLSSSTFSDHASDRGSAGPRASSRRRRLPPVRRSVRISCDVTVQWRWASPRTGECRLG